MSGIIFKNSPEFQSQQQSRASSTYTVSALWISSASFQLISYQETLS